MLDAPSLVRTAKLDIAYADTGPRDAPAVLLLHGWPDSARAWLPVAARLNAAGFRTIAPELRGFGSTRFVAPDTVRDGTGVALAQDAIDLADALGLEQFAVAGHDWGARAAYLLAALFPERIRTIAALALPFQPNGTFALPQAFSQARQFWYQWFMALDDGPAAVRADPKGFARIQWDTWSPPGWFDDAEFERTARAFENPDWVAVTLNGYRTRWRADEQVDADYDGLRARFASIDRLSVPTLMIQGGADQCDAPALSEHQAHLFSGGHTRLVLDGVGHFPPREAPDIVADAIIVHLS
ncbi:alpha/beta hydrolase [Trinickia caryophylli]|uniref:Pimeloyl-ACP methyl ester carboxylesterase n=1 Tax=Trinickia caryophylli TaxID=28094 RepID=A0A1X7FXS6_TRICW|nr:alpha/beta hydrolase [Trinickia caryophylli]PMS11831.1 alpha/beta hydrolase [Trinickia caryophylli]TRX17374.1 alpha/beta hydrolase [Trinickia caryophylli]WQE11885.1 alpha/beta hydrolase [Trinickia caryophylli]SMF60644.1 Pimeloyl-ACP methyl ester carboxylesterase [Trinickia caryophylli]GLU34610.1 alpha/beta hydrolase [Trinickia caryophylli]